MSINVLIVDDDKIKADRVRQLFTDLLPADQLNVQRANHLTEAGRLLETEVFQLLVLDLNIPLRSGETPKQDGGLKFLDQLYAGRKMKRPGMIVGLTAYGDLAQQHREAFAKKLWYLLEYDESSSEWSDKLSTLLLHLIDNVAGNGDGAYGTDIAIITALEDVELDAISQPIGR